jgi:hypothetical protein
MLDRVTAADEHSVLADQLERATSTAVKHSAVTRRTYRNAMVSRWGYTTRRTHQRWKRVPSLGEMFGPIVHTRELRYCYNKFVWQYFGHWIMDAIPTTLIDPERGSAWMPPDKTWHHAAAYIDLFALPLEIAPIVHADELVVYHDLGLGSHKRARFAVLREIVKSRYGAGDAGDCVYLRRGTTGTLRPIAEEERVIEHLSARNWKIVDVAEASVEEIQSALCRAQVVASMEGSHLYHAHLSLRSGGSLIILAPHDRFTTLHVFLARFNGLSPGMLVLDGSRDQGYHVDVDELFRTIDLAESQGAVGISRN